MKIDRQKVFYKYNGHCAYCGCEITILEMNIDHIFPKRNAHYLQSDVMKDSKGLKINNINDFENLNPSCKECNHYKRQWELSQFRCWLLGGLHVRLKKLPKNPKVKKSITRKNYLLKIANKYGITPERPFERKFYFEKLLSSDF